MPRFLAAATTLVATQFVVTGAAFAHPGHIAPSAGHSHEGLVVAAGAAIVVLAMVLALRSGYFRTRR